MRVFTCLLELAGRTSFCSRSSAVARARCAADVGSFWSRFMLAAAAFFLSFMIREASRRRRLASSFMAR